MFALTQPAGRQARRGRETSQIFEINLPNLLIKDSMLAPFVPTIDDDTELQVACAYVATKLKQIPDIETHTSSLCTFLVNQGIYCIGVLKATKFTPDQMDTLLKDHGMAGFRRTFEFAWKMSFTNPEAPAPGKLAVVKEDQSHLRPSRFVIEPDMIGKRLKKLGILKDVRLSPRLDDLIVNKTKPTPDDFDEIVKESVLYTFKVYGVANVDQLYLDTLCAPLNDKYTDLPEGKVFYKAIFHKTNNARKLNAKVCAKRTPARCRARCRVHTVHPLQTDPTLASRCLAVTGEATTLRPFTGVHQAHRGEGVPGGDRRERAVRVRTLL